MRNIIEYPPLSKQGYEGLVESFKRSQPPISSLTRLSSADGTNGVWRGISPWTDFISTTPGPIYRSFALPYLLHRTEADMKAEKEIASRLKKAYRAAKAMINKKKEKER